MADVKKKIDFDLSDAEKTLESARKKAKRLQELKERQKAGQFSQSSVDGIEIEPQDRTDA